MEHSASSRRTGAGLSLVISLTLLLVAGCRPPEERGPLFVALVVDSSASTAQYADEILHYAKLALDEYCRQETVHVAVINLDEDPKVEFQKTGDFYEEDIEDILAHVESIDSDARGTDIIGAMELALRYYGYQDVTPEGFKILCFTDGHIDAPPGGTVRAWGEFDWSRLAEMGAGVGLYFIDTDEDLRAEIESALGPLANTVVKNENEALDDLKWDEPAIP